MARLVVYARSSFCPDMHRWRRWVDEHPLSYVELDIERDEEAYAKVVGWTGHESVPTLVIAPDDSIDPIKEPEQLGNRGPRAVDRGTMLTEPNPGQIGPFLRRHGIPFGGDAGDDHPQGERAPGWWRRLGI